MLYVALLTAMLAYAVGSSGDIQAAWKRSQSINLDQADQLQDVVEEAERQENFFKSELARLGEAAQRTGVAELEKQISDAQAELNQLQAEQPSTFDAALAKATLNIGAIRDEHERLLRIAFLKREIEGLSRAADASRNYDAALVVSGENARLATEKMRRSRDIAASYLEHSQRTMNTKQAACRGSKTAVTTFDASWEAITLERLPFRHRRADLIRKRNADCEDARTSAITFAQARSRLNYLRQFQASVAQQPKRVRDWIDNDIPDTVAALKTRIAEERKRAKETITEQGKWAWTHYKIRTLIKRSLAAFVLIILSPFLVRLFCYFVLAPIAMRRSLIRLRVPNERGITIPTAAPSATSVAIRLAPNEELLVRQDYLQTSSNAGAKGTQWFLDWRTPVTSIATGLTFLTRIRGDGETTTISAIRDGLAEVTVLILPNGAACVLQPRALAAVAQPIGQRLRITRHWRLGLLNAWLTLQLRYLVFHGPARLVLKGGRGVRVEDAEQGRIFGQDQLVGFSADLGYSVTRVETFWPYFLGREQLLKDRVIAGEGVIIVEEAPLAGRRGAVRRGLEGMIDAGMKVFGM